MRLIENTLTDMLKIEHGKNQKQYDSGINRWTDGNRSHVSSKWGRKLHESGMKILP